MMQRRTESPPGARRRNRGLRRYGWFALALVVAVFLLFPIYWMVVSSIEPISTLLTRSPNLLPTGRSVSLSTYSSTFRQYPVATWLLDSAIVTIASVVLSLLVAVPAGYSLSRLRSRSASIAGMLMLLTRVIPGTLLVIPFFVMFSEVHLLNSLASLVIANASVIVPFAAWIMRGFFDAVPATLEEAARVDGCSYFAAFRRVILPLARPGIAATGVYAVILAWSDYLFARTLLLDPTHWTLTVGAVSLIGEQTVNWNGLMTMGVVAVIPMFAAFIVLEPFLVSGMTSGSVVG